MISAPSRSASARASAVFPTPVGPARWRIFDFSLGSDIMKSKRAGSSIWKPALREFFLRRLLFGLLRLLRLLGLLISLVATVGGLGAAHHELAAHVFLVVQFGDGALGLVDRLHLDESKALRTL